MVIAVGVYVSGYFYFNIIYGRPRLFNIMFYICQNRNCNTVYFAAWILLFKIVLKVLMLVVLV